MRSAPSFRAAKSTSILLVDDNVHGIVARKSVLEELGYTIISASSGSEALRLAEQFEFDLIVTDYRMPSMDGVQLIAALRRLNFERPIILLSGFLVHLGLTERSTGADLLIQKSANETDQLVRGVKRLLSAPKKPAMSQARTQLAKSRASKA
jgi:CheY-like chemotaxis protein